MATPSVMRMEANTTLRAPQVSNREAEQNAFPMRTRFLALTLRTLVSLARKFPAHASGGLPLDSPVARGLMLDREGGVGLHAIGRRNHPVAQRSKVNRRNYSELINFILDAI